MFWLFKKSQSRSWFLSSNVDSCTCCRLLMTNFWSGRWSNMTKVEVLLDCVLVLILWLQGDYFEECFSSVLSLKLWISSFFSKSSLLLALCFLIYVLPYLIAKLMENWTIMFVLAMQWLIDVPWRNSFLCSRVFSN